MSNMNKALNSHNKKTLSPCIGNCCLDLNDMCLGCFRQLEEIIGWSERSEKEKHDIILKCEQRKIHA